MKKFYILIMMILLVFPTYAEEWEKIDDKTYIDKSSIKWFKYPASSKNENIHRRGIEFKTKNMNDNGKNFADIEKIYNKKVLYLISKQIIDCKNQTIALKNYTAYDTKNIAFTSHNILYDRLKENKAALDPKSEYLLNYVCNYDIPEFEIEDRSVKETIKEQVKIENIVNTQDKTITNNKNKNENNIRDGVDYRSYMRELEYSLRKNWKPPKNTKPYRVVLYFTVLKDGRVKNIKVEKSSGNLETDEVAINTLKDTAPLKPLPAEYKGKSVDIRFTFDYFPMGYKNK